MIHIVVAAVCLLATRSNRNGSAPVLFLMLLGKEERHKTGDTQRRHTKLPMYSEKHHEELLAIMRFSSLQNWVNSITLLDYTIFVLLFLCFPGTKHGFRAQIPHNKKQAPRRRVMCDCFSMQHQKTQTACYE
jgi:hypothetical protein